MLSNLDQETDVALMRLALQEAEAAGCSGEVPVGAVVAVDGRPVGRGRNSPIGLHDPTGHAEILAMRAAGAGLGNYRLTGATLVTTLEPCLMCLGAAVHARIGRVVYGATDPKVGATALLDRIMEDGAWLNHRLQVTGGVLADEAGTLVTDFFRSRRSGEVPKWS